MRAKITFTIEADELVKELVSNQRSIDFIKDEINEKLNIKCSRSAIAKHIKELGLDISTNKIRKSLVNEKELILYLIDGLTYEQIADKLRVNIDTLKTFINGHNIPTKVEQEKIRLKTWIGNNTIDLRKIKDESLNDIEQYLNCKLEKNATVEFEGKKFIFDFYSKEHNIAFICCLYNPEKNSGLDSSEMPNRKHSITDRAQWDWINKIKEINPLMSIVSYFYWDSKATANHINEIMKDPLFIDDEEEKRYSSTLYFKNVIEQKAIYYGK